MTTNPESAVASDDVLLNDFKRQWADTSADVLAAVERVGQSGWYILGPSVAKFETSLASALGTGLTVGCGSGLDAIEIALRALGLTPGTRVLTTPLSAFATTLAIVRAGGRPVFLDVDESGNLDLEACARWLGDNAGVSYMVPVHLYGHALDLQRLSELRDRFGIQIVEDCAQAILAQSRGRRVGTVGALAALSFYPTKNLGALGDGGAVFGSDEGLLRACSMLRNYGQSARYVHDRLGVNSRLDELHAEVLESAFLPRLPAWTARRREVSRRYRAGLSHRDIGILPVPDGSDSVWHLFPVLVPPAQRSAFQEHLRRAAVQSAIHYPTLIPDQDALRGVTFDAIGPLTRARELAARLVSLPIHPYLTDAEVDRVIEAVNAWVPR